MLGFPEENIRILKGEEATKDKIGHAIYNELRERGMGREDRLLIFFAGHGEVAGIPGRNEGYLLPYDADLQRLRTSSLPMYDLSRINNPVLAKHILLVLDSCFSGFAVKKRSSVPLARDEYNQDHVVEVLTAGTSGQQAGEERGNGLFTNAFLDGLRGAADPMGNGLTAMKLAVYIQERFRDTSQSPQIAKLDGEGEFLFLPPTNK